MPVVGTLLLLSEDRDFVLSIPGVAGVRPTLL